MDLHDEPAHEDALRLAVAHAQAAGESLQAIYRLRHATLLGAADSAHLADALALTSSLLAVLYRRCATAASWSLGCETQAQLFHGAADAATEAHEIAATALSAIADAFGFELNSG